MIDPVWEQKYAEGYEQRYPWDSVVSFVYRYAPKNIPRKGIRVLEVGFGCGSNLWFAAKEGFSVAGIEASEYAVSYARARFLQERLAGDFRQGDFVSLPFGAEEFDLVIDRAALTHVGELDHQRALREINRVLKPGGYFHYNAYADTHSSRTSGRAGLHGVRVDITSGSLLNVGQVFFLSKSQILRFFAKAWKVHMLQRREWVNELSASVDIHSDWLVIAEKVS